MVQFFTHKLDTSWNECHCCVSYLNSRELIGAHMLLPVLVSRSSPKFLLLILEAFGFHDIPGYSSALTVTHSCVRAVGGENILNCGVNAVTKAPNISSC